MNELINSNICCLIITYNPDKRLLSLIENIEKQVGTIIIVDNNSEKSNFDMISDIAAIKGIKLVQNHENYGIAKALNQGIKEARLLNYKWVITFDQDTTPLANIIEIISEVYHLYPAKERIGAIGVNFSDSKNESYYKFADFQKYKKRDYLITSGCLMDMDIFFEIGGFREDLFIDNVDLEYSLRLRANNKVLLITKKWGMIHKAGDPTISKLNVLKIVSSNHKSSRRYFMARNHVILSRDYFFKFPYFVSKLNYFFFLSIIKIVFFEEDKRNKLMNSFAGIKDGIFYSSKNRKYCS